MRGCGGAPARAGGRGERKAAERSLMAQAKSHDVIRVKLRRARPAGSARITVHRGRHRIAMRR
jgi:hypothetical protein